MNEQNPVAPNAFRSTRTNLCLLAGALCFAVAIGIACSNAEQQVEQLGNVAPRVTVDDDGLHAVRNADLRKIMRKLHAMHLTEISSEIEMTGELRRNLAEVATMADSLAADAQLMPHLLDDETMTDEARRVLIKMSARMHEEATHVASAARDEDLPVLRNHVRDMLDVCADCHREFRAPMLVMASPRR